MGNDPKEENSESEQVVIPDWEERVGLKETAFAAFAWATCRRTKINMEKTRKNEKQETHTFRGDVSGYGVALLLTDWC